MQLSDFSLGLEFYCGDGQWRCTDIGSRVIVAIRIDEARITTTSDGETSTATLGRQELEAEDWFDGPPYALAEIVFDEHDMEACSFERDEAPQAA